MNRITIPSNEDAEITVKGFGKFILTKTKDPNELVFSVDGNGGGCSSVVKKRKVRKD